MKIIRYTTGEGMTGRIICEPSQEKGLLKALKENTWTKRGTPISVEDLRTIRFGTHN